jgi:hypothetical protein
LEILTSVNNLVVFSTNKYNVFKKLLDIPRKDRSNIYHLINPIIVKLKKHMGTTLIVEKLIEMEPVERGEAVCQLVKLALKASEEDALFIIQKLIRMPKEDRTRFFLDTHSFISERIGGSKRGEIFVKMLGITNLKEFISQLSSLVLYLVNNEMRVQIFEKIFSLTEAKRDTLVTKIREALHAVEETYTFIDGRCAYISKDFRKTNKLVEFASKLCDMEPDAIDKMREDGTLSSLIPS